MFATNAESVTMSTYKWLNYFDLNMYNGVIIGDSTYTYKMGGEIGYNFSYVLSKTLFLHFGLGAARFLIGGYCGLLACLQ